MKLSPKVINNIEHALFRVTLLVFGILPYPVVKAILIGLFDLIGYRIGIRKKLALQQLKEIYPTISKSEAQRIIRRMYRHMALNVADIYFVSDNQLFAKSRFENLEYAQLALEKNKGVLLITGHFGNWEAPFRVLPMAGIGIAAITKKQRNAKFDDYTNRIRERQGGTIIDMKVALRGILEHTAHNDMIGILIDQDAGRRGMLLNFLGKPASNWTGTAKIALKYKIPIVPGFVIRDQDDKLVFRFEEMIDPSLLQDTEENLLTLMSEMNKTLEEKINTYPEQWFWVHKRWKGARHFSADGQLLPKIRKQNK